MKKALIGVLLITSKWLAWMSIMGMGVLVCFVFYWSLYPYKIIEVKEPAKIVGPKMIMMNGSATPAVKRGEILTYKMEYTKFMPITAKVRRQLVNDRSICLMEGAGQAKMGRNSVLIDVFIPLNIFPGRYKLQTFYEYEVNPIRTIKYEYDTEWFEILP
jgi:hypothetical protein